MKMKLEPTRAVDFAQKVLLGKSGSSKLENIPLLCKPKGITTSNMFLEVIGLKAIFTNSFFIEYECKEDETLILTADTLKVLTKGFKADKTVTFFTDSENLYIRGSRETFKEPIREATQDVPISFPTVLTEKGFISAKDEGGVKTEVPSIIQASLDVSEIDLMTPSEKTFFNSNGKQLVIKSVFKSGAEFEKIMELSKRPDNKLGVLETSFYTTWLDAIVSNLDKEIWLTMSNDWIIASLKRKGYVLSYFLTTAYE